MKYSKHPKQYNVQCVKCLNVCNSSLLHLNVKLSTKVPMMPTWRLWVGRVAGAAAAAAASRSSTVRKWNRTCPSCPSPRDLPEPSSHERQHCILEEEKWSFIYISHQKQALFCLIFFSSLTENLI